ncbi:MAG: glycosyltransferase family 4 protein [Pseudomonadota bacterium]
MKLLYVVNQASFFVSHRLPLALEAQRLGFDVAVACGRDTGEEKLIEAGVMVHTIRLSRSGTNVFAELRTLRELLRLYRAFDPDIVHHVTIKPVLYGTIAARLARVPAVVNAIPGLGFVFTRRGALARVRRQIINQFYRLALRHDNMRVIFQNGEDRESFVNASVVRRPETVLIRGSGVDLTQFEASPEPDTPLVFVLVARMLRDKGVFEFVAAAEQLKKRYPDWRFWLVGDVDPGNPVSLTLAQLQAWDTEGAVEWLGQRDDVSDILRSCHVLCLPSYYREGLPKSLLEAAASERAIIASRVAGCLEVVTDGVTGLIVEPRDVGDLVVAMQRLGTDKALRERLARAARNKAEALFSVDEVVQDTFIVYEQLSPDDSTESAEADAFARQSQTQ